VALHSALGPNQSPELIADHRKPMADSTPDLSLLLSPAREPGELGRLGPHRILKVLRTGGMGVVFEAEDTLLHRRVALKALLPSLNEDPIARERFLRECQALAAIEHDHIVRIHLVSEDRGVLYLAMQLLQGETLEERLQRESPLSTAEALRIGREVALGLAAAHSGGLIHRDIKPANIWLESATGQTVDSRPRRADALQLTADSRQPTADGRVKIIDFGLVRLDKAMQLTKPGAILGTPAYMAPEQASRKPVDSRCDLYSLGCVLYRLSTGELPFKGKDAITLLLAASTEKPISPRQHNPSLPAALSDLILRLLAKDPNDRPATALAVVEALQAIEAKRAGQTTLLEPGPGTFWRILKSVGRRCWPWA
jgi:serine/threonine protein kinase